MSRSTILYYESIGLLKPAPRSSGNYRTYTEADVRRVQQIRTYRDAGLTIADVRTLLTTPSEGATGVLLRRLRELDAEVATLRRHQASIVRLLRHGKPLRRTIMMTKDKWVAIMRAAGFDEPAMHRWHSEFERSAPDDHQEFLEYLRIAPEEIRSIRAASREGGSR